MVNWVAKGMQCLGMDRGVDVWSTGLNRVALHGLAALSAAQLAAAVNIHLWSASSNFPFIRGQEQML